jgi:hypothetical protein
VKGGDGLLLASGARCRALTLVVPLLDPKARQDVCLEAWRLAPRAGSVDGATLLRALMPTLATLEPQALADPWRHELELAAHDRSTLVEWLEITAPIVHRLAGAPAVRSVLADLEQTLLGWP